ncbi:MAG: serine hydrolase [Woeseiaceae bacterium]|nr:serine hydrolase [Woeseiaceae bacterium]
MISIFATHWRGLAALAMGLALVGCGGGGNGGGDEPLPPPAYTYRAPADLADTWTIAHAADFGVDTARLETMMDDIRRGQFPSIDSIVVAKDGALVFDETIRTRTDAEDARVGNTDPAIHAQFSATKSVTSLVVGIAIDEGHIDGTETPFLELLPYTDYANPDERKASIKLEHVLAMRSGIEWDEFDPPYTSPDNQLIRFYAEQTDYTKAFFDLPMAGEPGERFAYATPASVALGMAVETAVPISLIDFSLTELILPLGISEVELLTTPTGLPDGGRGLYVRTRDMAKFGQLLLNGGTWNGQRIVSESWIEASLVPRTTVGWADPAAWDWQLQGYGWQWWLGYYDHGATQRQAWVGWGFGGQWVVAIPSLSLVVAVNSHGYDGSDAALNEGHALIRRYVLDAVLP